MISPAYTALNARLHESRPDYGVSGQRHADLIAHLIAQSGAASLLDYGCGKGTLCAALRERGIACEMREYDPAIPGKDAAPVPADVVACTDVLEHVEPEHVDAVIADLRRVTRKVGVYTIATRPAVKHLEDGRNAHLIVQPMAWWLPKFLGAFEIKTLQNAKGEFAMVVA